MPDELHFLELTELAQLLRRREISAVEVTRAQLVRISNLDRDLASFVRVTPERALAAATAADAEIADGHYRGPLHGVPLGIKDLFWTEGVPTAAGMAIHRDFVPLEDASAVARLKDAGAVLLGKLQMTEGAYSDHHPSITPPTNPWNPDYWTGISSSGAAAATAAGLCFGALGSDTGGSIRWPCGATGLTGIKPTWGRVSRFGSFELAASLDQIGPIARSVAPVPYLSPRHEKRRQSGPTPSLPKVSKPGTSRDLWPLHRRMTTQQQMRWSYRRAHSMLEVRTSVMNGTLVSDHAVAERWARRPFAMQPDHPHLLDGLVRTRRAFRRFRPCAPSRRHAMDRQAGSPTTSRSRNKRHTQEGVGQAAGADLTEPHRAADFSLPPCPAVIRLGPVVPHVRAALAHDDARPRGQRICETLPPSRGRGPRSQPERGVAPPAALRDRDQTEEGCARP
jgi:hypothetical protein